jgi:hypothetical protein
MAEGAYAAGGYGDPLLLVAPGRACCVSSAAGADSARTGVKSRGATLWALASTTERTPTAA